MAFLGAPEYETNHANLLRKIIRVLDGVMRGKTNNTGTFTLTANSATTTLTFAAGQIGQDTVITWMPTTSNAAGAMANLYLSSRNVASSTMTFTHSNTATNNRTFSYVLTG